MWYGKDGRSWHLSRPDHLLSRLGGRTVILDENHATFYDAPAGKPSPAMARMSNFSMDPRGVIWANTVDWTAAGKQKWSEGAYLGLSPVVLFDPNSREGSDLGEVVDIQSVALVNDPNLPIPAVNASQISMAKTNTENTPNTPAPAAQPEAPKSEPQAPAPDLSAQITAAVNTALSPVVAALQALPAALAALAPKPGDAAPVAAPNAAQVHAQSVSAECEKLISAGKIYNTAEDRAIFALSCPTPEALKISVAAYEKRAPLVNQPISAPNSSVTRSPGAAEPFTSDQVKIMKLHGWKPEDLYTERFAK